MMPCGQRAGRHRVGRGSPRGLLLTEHVGGGWPHVVIRGARTLVGGTAPAHGRPPPPPHARTGLQLGRRSVGPTSPRALASLSPSCLHVPRLPLSSSGCCEGSNSVPAKTQVRDLPYLAYLEIESLQMETAQRRSLGFGWALNPMAGVLAGRGESDAMAEGCSPDPQSHLGCLEAGGSALRGRRG